MQNSSTPTISAVIPCYNASRTLGRCIEALKAQSAPPFEIIVADDCSTDDSAHIAERLGARPVRLPENRGAASARNAGAKQASGDVILFVDADVELLPDAVEKILARFESAAKPDAVIGFYSLNPPVAGLSANVHNLLTCYNHNREEGRIDWFWGAIGAIKRSVFEKLRGFDERYSGANAEDLELGWRMTKEGFRSEMDKSVIGHHLAKLDLVNALKNDFRKGGYALEFFKAHDPSMRINYAYAKVSNALSLALCAIFAASPIAMPFCFSSAAVVAMAAFVAFAAVNFGFFRFASEHKGLAFALMSAPIYFAFFTAIGFGIAWGVVRIIWRGK